MAEPEPPPVGGLLSAAQLRKKANRGSTMATLNLGLPNFAAADEPTPPLGRQLARAWAFRKLHHAGAAAFTGEDDGYLAEEQLEELDEEEQLDGGGLDPASVADAPVASWVGDPDSANEQQHEQHEQHEQHRHRQRHQQQHRLDLAGDDSQCEGERHAGEDRKETVESLAVRPPPFPPPLYGRPPSYNTSNLLHASGALPVVLAQLPSAVDPSSLGSGAPSLSPVEREAAPISVPLSAASRDEYDEVVGSVLMQRRRRRRPRPVSLAAGFGRPRPSLTADGGFAENGPSFLPGSRPSRYCCSFSAPTSPVQAASPEDDVDEQSPPSLDPVVPDEPDEPDDEDEGQDDPKEYYWQYLSLKREYEFLVSQFSSLRAQTLAMPSSAPPPDPPARPPAKTVVVDAAVQTEEVEHCTICRGHMSAATATAAAITETAAPSAAPRKRRKLSLPPPSPDGCEQQQSREDDVERHWDEENLEAFDEEADLEVGQGTAWSWFLWLASGIAIIGRELIRVSLHCWEMADDDLRVIAL